jgi:LysM repeat protein
VSEQHDARPDDAPAMPDERPPAGACPFLGLAADPASHFDFPSSEHRCRSAASPVYVELAHQGTYCLTSRHVSCARYVGPDAVVAAAPQVPVPPVAPRDGASSQPPPEARASYTLAARGGFGALAATPRGWVPVETSTPAPSAPTIAPPPTPVEPPAAVPPAAVTAGPMPDDGTLVEDTPAPGPAPDPGTSVAADGAGAADPAPPAAAEQTAAAEAMTAADPEPAAPEPAAPEPTELEPDPEGLGALVAADAAADATAPPVTTADAPSVAAPAADALASVVVAESAADALAADRAGDGTAGLEGPAALEGAAVAGIGARLAGIGRHLLRGLVIVLAALLVLVALVGLGYVAGKALVRPGESVPSAVSSPDPATPLVTPPGSGSSEAPGAGAATTPPLPGASATPAPSTPAAATARPTPAAKPTPRATPKPRVYVVKSGDTLFSIAERFGVAVSAIIAANDITDPNTIVPGQRLTIPRP